MTAGLTLVATAASVALGAANGADPGTKSYLIFVTSCAVAGGLVAGARPGNALGWALLGSAFSFALLEVCGEYAVLAAVPAAAWPETWLWVPANLGVALVPLLFPDGRLPGRRWWWLVGPLGVAATAAAVLGALRPGPPGQVRAGGPPNPLGIDGLAGPADAVAAVFTVAAGLTFVAGAVAVLVRPEERPRTKWVAWAGAIAAAVVLARLIAGLTDADPGSPWPRQSLLWEYAGALALSLLPAAVTVAVLRHRLYDVDLLIARTLLWGIMSAALVGGYVLLVAYLGALAGRESSMGVSVLAAAVVAVAFAPLRERVQKAITIFWYGRREEPYAVLARLGRRLEQAVAPLPAIAETVAEALRADHVAIEVPGGDPVAVGTGTAAATVAVPLTYRGENVGTLRVQGRFDARLLDDIGPQVGVAVHAARLSYDLQRSRERLVMAREEERRRLRRDLHDGLGPTLAALTMRAEAAQELADGSQVKELLGRVVDDAEAAVRDVRRLVDGLRPAALDSLGLVGALQAHLAGLPGGGPLIRVLAPPELPALPAATEVAAYRIAVEAVTNVRRHAAATEATVRLEVGAGRLTVDVSDDGCGARGVSAGVGLTSMRERAGELGGTVTVDSGPAGTRVRAELPAEA
ncbi:sensor histidine kinase [Paractinoplanes rishiriensis]|uniref:Histidine kinase/HSP90-like ATPase domain-containing protein n=1 Tax=Paractinoplanes rishiriensis TaxID=1050105 RepID=A0A919N2V0_9ACTN|nr:sensor histidine kinase [Actinoplanes rishiriensis]GIF02038.1 hypothetical protein Ari01nite_95020 [Actinoplanes rishiriensis]